MEHSQFASQNRKKFVIRGDECCNFVAGISADGEQVLIGVAPLHVVAVFFDCLGRFLRHEVRKIPHLTLDLSLSLIKNLLPDFAESELVDSWSAEIGLARAPVTIYQFHLPDWDLWGNGIGLFELPQFLQEVADDPFSEENEQLRSELLGLIEWFRTDERFVVRWGTEYWMSKEGEITDT